jgi:hypothetical protein
LGIGGIDFLDSLSQQDGVEGIIGTGNALFLARDFSRVYSAHSPEELLKCYEMEGAGVPIRFLEEAPTAPFIILTRALFDTVEYDRTLDKLLSAEDLAFQASKTFARLPMRYAGSMKSRLRGKFIGTSRVVHCARRPTLMEKECLFDDIRDVRQVIDRFQGHFLLVYTMWDQQMCDAEGMANTRKLGQTYNPTDSITPHFLRIAQSYVHGGTQ